MANPRPDRPPDRTLVTAKLRALVRARTGVDPEAPAGGGRPGLGLPAGAAAVEAGGEPWLLLEWDPAAALGPALLWLHRAGAWERGHVVVTGADDLVALRVGGFAEPPHLAVVRADEAVDVPVPPLGEAAARAGDPVRHSRERLTAGLDEPAAGAVVALLDAALARHPRLVPEPTATGTALTLDGLEVAHIVVTPEGAAFEVGVGEHDQHARRQVAGHRLVGPGAIEADLADLAHAVTTVERFRGGERGPHPLQRLRPARRLRARVVADPVLAGLPGGTVLDPVVDPAPVRSMRRDRPAVAVAAGGDGGPEAAPSDVVVCSYGVDLDAVPTAVHAWLQACRAGAETPRLTVVVAERDAHPATSELLSRVRPEAEARLVTLPPEA